MTHNAAEGSSRGEPMWYATDRRRNAQAVRACDGGLMMNPKGDGKEGRIPSAALPEKDVLASALKSKRTKRRLAKRGGETSII